MNQDVANEFLGCQPGKLNGERMNDQVIDAGILQQLHAFLDGIDEFDTAFLLQHHSWMRKKSKHYRFQGIGFCRIHQSLNDLAMPGVNAIKSTDGHHRLVFTGKRIRASMSFQICYFPLNEFMVLDTPAVPNDWMSSADIFRRSGNSFRSCSFHSPNT